MKTNGFGDKKALLRIFSFIILSIIAFPTAGIAGNQEPNWIVGPATVDLKDNIAEITIDEYYAFLDGDDTRAVMKQMGNPPSGNEVGLIIPKTDPPPWYLVFEYFPVGFIKDDEKDQIDSDAILDSIKEGTEQANKQRTKMGFSPLEVLGWHEEPHYDDLSNNLVWTLLCEEGEGVETVNYNVRLLGRKGYMSVVLVANLETLRNSKMELDYVLSNFAYKDGNRYAEFTQGDKIAKYGLTALIVGGTATIAAKAGIFKMLAKFAKPLIVGFLAVFAAFGRKLKSLLG